MNYVHVAVERNIKIAVEEKLNSVNSAQLEVKGKNSREFLK
jgi:hypothetical protein